MEPDSVWLSAGARLAGLARRAAEEAEAAQVLVLAHFPDALEAVAGALRGLGARRVYSAGHLASRLASPRAGELYLALVAELPAPGPGLAGPAEGVVSFLVAERHPLRAEDERVERLAAGLPYATRVRFHVALDDPILERYENDRVKALLVQLGMDEEDEICHAVVSRAIAKAQRVNAARAAPGAEAESAAEWMRALEPE